MPLLSVPHRLQLDDGYCLAACVEMVLAYYDLALDQASIAEQIGIIRGLGAAAFNILRLRIPGMRVTYQRGEPADLPDALSRRVPPILSVFTAELPYWNVESLHALVLTGIRDEIAFVNDPAFPEPMQVSLNDLLLAWDERDNSIAFIQPSS